METTIELKENVTVVDKDGTVTITYKGKGPDQTAKTVRMQSWVFERFYKEARLIDDALNMRSLNGFPPEKTTERKHKGKTYRLLYYSDHGSKDFIKGEMVITESYPDKVSLMEFRIPVNILKKILINGLIGTKSEGWLYICEHNETEMIITKEDIYKEFKTMLTMPRNLLTEMYQEVIAKLKGADK